jgi:hypothetical protein
VKEKFSIKAKLKAKIPEIELWFPTFFISKMIIDYKWYDELFEHNLPIISKLPQKYDLLAILKTLK